MAQDNEIELTICLIDSALKIEVACERSTELVQNHIVPIANTRLLGNSQVTQVESSDKIIWDPPIIEQTTRFCDVTTDTITAHIITNLNMPTLLKRIQVLEAQKENGQSGNKVELRHSERGIQKLLEELTKTAEEQTKRNDNLDRRNHEFNERNKDLERRNHESDDRNKNLERRNNELCNKITDLERTVLPLRRRILMELARKQLVLLALGAHKNKTWQTLLSIYTTPLELTSYLAPQAILPLNNLDITFLYDPSPILQEGNKVAHEATRSELSHVVDLEVDKIRRAQWERILDFIFPAPHC